MIHHRGHTFSICMILLMIIGVSMCWKTIKTCVTQGLEQLRTDERAAESITPLFGSKGSDAKYRTGITTKGQRYERQPTLDTESDNVSRMENVKKKVIKEGLQTYEAVGH